MNEKDENICRLCLHVADNEYQIVDEITRKIFNTLLLRVNLDISKDPIICKDCEEAMKECYYFKSSWNDIEEQILTFATGENTASFELKDIFEDRKNIDTDLRCRFCTNHLGKDDLITLDILMKDVTFAEMLQMVMPKMDLDIIKNSVICTSCKHHLKCYIKLINNCLDTEMIISKYCLNVGSTYVRLSDILTFWELDKYAQSHAIKQEDLEEIHFEVPTDKLTKTEESIDVKGEELYSNETASETSSDNRYFYETKQTRNLSSHMEFHNYAVNAEIYRCDLCTFQAKHKDSLRRHMVVHSDVKMYKCGVCTFETKYKSNLNKHVVIHKDIEMVERYKCAMCAYETKHKNCIKKHKVVHKDNEDIAAVHLYNNMYKCTLCTFQAEYKYNIKLHMLKHKEVKEDQIYKCTICPYETRRKSCMRKHLIMHKDITEVETYKCFTCAFETRYKNNLIKHMKIHRDNTEVTMHKCTMCTFETKHNESLIKHMIVHKDLTEVDLYKCTMCTFETKRKGSLKNHMLIHKDITEVEMHICEMCNFKTKHKDSLKKHMLVHKDITEVQMYKCSMCTYETKHKGCFKRHMLTH